MKLPGKLSGKISVIIGGTSGLGEAIAKAFVEEGALVIPVSRGREKVGKAVRSLKKSGNLWKETVTVDILKESSVEKALKQIVQKTKRIDIVVCTAGCHLKKDFLKMKTSEWQKVMDTNLRGTYFVNKHFGKAMLKRKNGSLINISSLGAQVALSGAAAYCVSKAGVSMLTKSLAIEWAKRGVRVNAILPGVFPTPLNQKALRDKSRRRKIIQKTPLKRMGKPSEIAGAAIYLASDESRFVTGTELVVDGGFLASSGF